MGKTYKKKPLAVVHVKPVTGALDTTINPGDEVMVVRSGYSNNVHCDKGIYIGYIVSEPTGNLRARVQMEKPHYSWHFPDGREFDWRTDYNRDTYDEVKKTLVHRESTRTFISTLWLNRIATLK